MSYNELLCETVSSILLLIYTVLACSLLTALNIERPFRNAIDSINALKMGIYKVNDIAHLEYF